MDEMTLLYQAANEPIALIVSTDDPHRLRTILYRARRKSGDFLLKDLEFRILPDNQLAIVNRREKGSENCLENQ